MKNDCTNDIEYSLNESLNSNFVIYLRSIDRFV